MNDDRLYQVHRVTDRPALDGDWNAPAWRHAETCSIEAAHPQSSAFRPRTQARLLYDTEGIFVFFNVRDRYVLSTHTGFQSSVWQDACVEVFLQPKPDLGYFNFEMNCGGNLLLHYNEKETPDARHYERLTPLPEAAARAIPIYHSMPEVVSPEIQDDTSWRVAYFIPFTVFEPYVGSLSDVAGQTWRGNFYKCAEDCSHPHWVAWAPIGDELNFHRPEFFGRIQFVKT